MKRNATSGFAAASAIASVYGMKWAVRYGADRERDHHSCRAARRARSVRYARLGLINIFVQVGQSAGATHEKPEAEQRVRSSNYKCPPTPIEAAIPNRDALLPSELGYQSDLMRRPCYTRPTRTPPISCRGSSIPLSTDEHAQ